MTLEGRTVLITGANTGIGKATAGALARMGATLFLACRTEARTAPVIAALEGQTGRKDFHFLPLELGDLDSVAACGQAFERRGLAVDVLILNAGIGTGRTPTTQGFEPMFGINHLGHFLLAQLLRPSLERATAPRLVSVASRAATRVKALDLEHLRGPGRSLSGWPEYGRSKLCNVLFVRELPKRWTGTRATSYAVHPGVIASDIMRPLPSPIRALMGLAMSTPEEGCRSSVRCATAPELNRDTGKYYDEDGVETRPGHLGQDDALAAKLWDLSLELVKPWLTPLTGESKPLTP
jgi:retinol dehydrogenase-12